MSVRMCVAVLWITDGYCSLVTSCFWFAMNSCWDVLGLCRAQCEFCWFCYTTSRSFCATTTTLSVMSFRQTASKSAISCSVRSLAICDFPIRSRQTWRSICCRKSRMRPVWCQTLSASYSRSRSKRLTVLHSFYYFLCFPDEVWRRCR